MPFGPDVDIQILVSMIKETAWTGAEVSAWCRESALEALRQDIKSTHIDMKHFQRALDLMKI